jgi:hypothetical protein
MNDRLDEAFSWLLAIAIIFTVAYLLFGGENGIFQGYILPKW